MILDRIPVRLRLSLGHAIWMALLFAGLGLGLYRVVEHNLYQSVDAALSASARSIRDARFVRGFNSPLMEEFLSKFFGERYIRPYAQLVELSGKVSARTGNMRVTLPVSTLAIDNAEKGVETFETFKRSSNGTPIRQITLPVFYNSRFTGELIQVGAPLDSTLHTLRGITIVLWLALPAGLVVSILFGYLLTRRALLPVTNIQQAAARLGAADLAVRLPLSPADDELRSLAQTFNEMLDRLEDAFKRLRRFSGDVSHELRTPIAVLRAEAELALRRERSTEEYRSALKSIVNESTTMSSIIEDLLLLARAESRAVAMHWDPIATERFVSDVVDSVKIFYDKKNIQLKIICTAKPIFDGNAGYLALALKNILLNACKHSACGGNVELDVKNEGDSVTFSVRDCGEGIPEKDLPYIFDPFYRADTARNRSAGGAGVGLSLAMALVRLHNGNIHAQSKIGEGATFKICLGKPAASEAADFNKLVNGALPVQKSFPNSLQPSNAT